MKPLRAEFVVGEDRAAIFVQSIDELPSSVEGTLLLVQVLDYDDALELLETIQRSLTRSPRKKTVIAPAAPPKCEAEACPEEGLPDPTLPGARFCAESHIKQTLVARQRMHDDFIEREKKKVG